MDDFRITNPPTNQALIDALAKDFVENKYRLRHTVRLILNSRVYQLSSEPNETNRTDELNYSHYYLRRLMAEQLADTLSQVSGVAEKYRGFLPGTHAMSIPQGAPSRFLLTFGRVKSREVICERDNQPDMAQAMHLISGDTLRKKTIAKDGLLSRWLADSSITDEDIVRRLFVSALVRPPDERELSLALAPIRAVGTSERRQAFEDTLWALFNSKEFLYNH